MWQLELFVALCFGLFIGILSEEIVTPSGRVELVSGAVYQISNKLDGGSLSVYPRSMDSWPVSLSEFNSTNAGQKWRLRKSTFGKSFQLLPTSNERAVLDLDRRTIGSWGRIAAFGNQKFWNLNGMGESVIQIQNWVKAESCLTSNGLGKEVTVAECDNSQAQQWIFTRL